MLCLCSGSGSLRAASPHQASIALTDERGSHTPAFERYGQELSRHMTIPVLAHHLGISWDVIKEIQKRYLMHRFAKPRLKHVRHIAIAEINIGKGHRYLTLVFDLDSGAIVFVGEREGADFVHLFLKKPCRAGARIRAAATDLSSPYPGAPGVHENLPAAIHVFRPRGCFHMVKLFFNDQLAGLRREVQRSAEKGEHKKLLKGTL